MHITFTIPGPPTGKARPRFARIGNFVRTYTPETSARFENLVKLAYREQCQEPPTESPVSMEVRVYFPIPKSWPKKKSEAARNSDCCPVTTKPDIDNCLKSILDGLNGVAFQDDKQVFRIECMKFYSNQPRTEVTVQVI